MARPDDGRRWWRVVLRGNGDVAYKDLRWDFQPTLAGVLMSQRSGGVTYISRPSVLPVPEHMVEVPIWPNLKR